jgi:hypothetical protein
MNIKANQQLTFKFVGLLFLLVLQLHALQRVGFTDRARSPRFSPNIFGLTGGFTAAR